jgi:predicted DNA-binding WGR domain protein
MKSGKTFRRIEVELTQRTVAMPLARVIPDAQTVPDTVSTPPKPPVPITPSSTPPAADVNTMYCESDSGVGYKVWSVWIDGFHVWTEWGKEGGTLHRTNKLCATSWGARHEKDKLIRSKRNKGYRVRS